MQAPPVGITDGHSYELSIPLWALWLVAAAAVAVLVGLAARRGRRE